MGATAGVPSSGARAYGRKMSTVHERTSTDDDGTTTHTEEHVEASSVTEESGSAESTPDGSGSNTAEGDDHEGDVGSGG